MKWLVFLLACANTGIYLVAMNFAVESDRRVIPDGQLPGVDSLRRAQGGARSEAGRWDDGLCLQVTGLSQLDQPGARIRKALSAWRPVTLAPIRSGTSKPLHHLLVPPMASRSAALERLRELQASGVDSYLLEEGPHQWAISLGVFESADGARRLSSRFQSRNIETILVKRPPDPVGYALAFADRDVPAKDIAGELRNALPDSASVAVGKGCQGVASPDKNP
ncbi:hypothetical protein CF392_15035 [Tamilnaduibacter salinus]|uniref:SPOR domain-containing protein n=1 Tax=Tamilnaduibacter salinus TaxID=1484056 RepID=A0A2A2HYT2_9GAMM|nr:hypothetical protein [Tamilnaduibacter salinus]PAV24661.1 hypothetical protein CF392_15035 [Tamilnaduibacter salinus]